MIRSKTLLAALGLALVSVPPAARAATWYWDSNGTTAGAGGTPSGNWGSDNYWNSDPTGGAAGSFTTSVNASDTAVFVAGPGATSGTGGYAVTLGFSQNVAGLVFQSSGKATIAPPFTSDTTASISIGSGGLTMPVNAYGSTPQGSVTINAVTRPTASGTWQVGNGSSYLKLAGQFFSSLSNTVTLTGAGMTYITSTNNAPAFGGSNNNLSLVVKNAAVSFASNDFYSPTGGIFTSLAGATFVPTITLDGGRLSYVYGTDSAWQDTQRFFVGAGGGVFDFAQTTRIGSVNGPSQKFSGGSVGAPVAVTKIGAGALSFGIPYTGSMYATFKAYGGSIQLRADGNFAGQQRTTKIYGLDIIGGDVNYADASMLDSSMLASAGNAGQVKLRSAGGSLGIYRVLSGTQGAADLSADSGSAVYFLGGNATAPNMATLADGRMWLSGTVTVSATSGLAGSDGTYRILGNTYTGANAFTGSGQLLIGSRLYNGGAAYYDNSSPMPAYVPTQINAAQNFSGTASIAGPNDTGRAYATNYDASQAVLGAANALGSVAAVNVGANSTLIINADGVLADSAPVSLDNGRLMTQGANGPSINETIGAVTVSGASEVRFDTVSFQQLPTIRTPSLSFAAGGALLINSQNAGQFTLGSQFNGPRFIVTGNTGTAAYSGAVLAMTGNNNESAFVRNDPTYGMTPITFQDPGQANWTASSYVQGNAVLTGNRTVGGLKTPTNGSSEINMSGYQLTVDGGGIIGVVQTDASSYTAMRLGVSGSNAGSLTAGSSAPVIDGKPTLYLYSQARAGLDQGLQFEINTRLTGTMNVSLVGLQTGTGADTPATSAFFLNNTANDFTGTVFFNNGSAGLIAAGDGVFGDAANQLTFNGGWLRSDVTTSRQVNVLDGGATLTAGTYNGKVTGSGPIMIGMAPYNVVTSPGIVGGTAATTVTFGSATNDYTGVLRLFGNGMPETGATLRASAANVLGNNATYSMQSNTLIDLTNGGATPAGFSQTMGQLEGTGDVNIGASGVLTVGGNGQNATFLGRIIGGGNLVKTGAGSWVLGGQSTYAGTTSIDGGVIALGSAENPGVSGPLGGAASTIFFNGGTLQYSNLNTYDYSSRASTTAGQQFRVDTNGQSVTWASNLSSSGGTLTKVGSGTWTVSGSNSYDGDTRASAGTLALGGVNALAASTLDMNAADAGIVTFTAAGTQTYNVGGLKGSRDLAIGGNTLSVGGNGQSTTYSGPLSGSGTLRKAGAGTLTLSGSNAHSGGTTLAGGTLALASAGALGSSGTISFTGGTLQYSGSNTADYSGRFSNAAGQQVAIDTNGQNVTLASNLTSSGGSLTKLGNGTLTMSGTNSYSGGSTVSAGRLVGTTSSLQGGITNNAAVEFAQATAGTYGGVISGSGSVTKTGGGSLTFSGSNSYGGTTTVAAGALLVNGDQSGATGSLSVAAGATLGGDGTIGGDVSVAGIHSPGNSPGVQTINGDLTYAAGSSVLWELIANTTGGSSAYDQIVLPTGDLTFSGATALDLSFNSLGSLVNWENPFWSSNRNWMLHDVGDGTTTGLVNFTINVQDWLDGNGIALSASSRAGATFNIAQVGQDVTLNYVAPVPEPSTLALAGLAAVGLAIRGWRRRASRD